MQSDHPLQHWFSTTTGSALLQQEREWNSAALKRVYGMHLLQLGMVKENFAKQATEVYHAFVMDVCGHEEQSWAVLEGVETALPIATESLSAVILPHVLEFSTDPHQVLREVTRVLSEEGTIILYGFSPWSLLNWSRRLAPERCLSAGKVGEWLELLGYEVVKRQQLPWLSWSWRSSRLNTGLYQLVAKRRVAPLNPVRPHWKQRAAIATGNLVNRSGCEVRESENE